MEIGIQATDFEGAGIRFRVYGGVVQEVYIDPDEASHGFLVLLADVIGAAWEAIDGDSTDGS